MYSGDWRWCRQDVHHCHDVCLFNSSFCCGWRWWLCWASPCESFFYTNCTSDWQSYPFQLTAFILAVPAHVCVYKRIQKFDTVHIIAGPFANMIGTVVHIYHRIGWYTIKTLTCNLWIYRMDIELGDRLCMDDYVWVITTDGPFLGRCSVVKKVDAEGNIEMEAHPSNVSKRRSL